MVGDQSSGKSSLLEGLTGLSFPIASDLCTRFATQIVLRRSSPHEASVKVSIIPGPTANNDEAQKQHLLAFEKIIEGHELSSQEFASILNDVRRQRRSEDAADFSRLLSTWVYHLSKTKALRTS